MTSSHRPLARVLAMIHVRLILPIVGATALVAGLCCGFAQESPPGGAAQRIASRPPEVPAPARAAGERLQQTGQTGVRPQNPAVDRERLFEGWENPQAVLVLTGQLGGYIEPCGCAGKDHMKGGVSRRHTFVRSLDKRGWPTVLLDAGGQVKRFGPQPTIKYSYVLQALREMDYQAISFGPRELGLPDTVGEVLEPKNRFVSANVDLFGQIPKQRILEAGGLTIGVTSVLGDRARKQVQSSDFELSSAAEALVPVAKAMKPRCDLMVLLAYATPEEAKALARAVPQFDFVVVADGAAEPPAQPERLAGTPTTLLEVGGKGMFAVVVGLFDDAKTPWRYQRVPLDSRFEDSPEMVAIMTNYQAQLRAAGWEGLGARARKHPAGHGFVGSQKCVDCHDSAHGQWLEQRHATALDTLAKLEVPRLHDPECISCHVVGWNPQGYFPYETGFESLDKTPHLAHVGCETCHGPGGGHVAAEWGEVELTEEQILAHRRDVRVTLDQAEKGCRECHDLDNSPQFDFKTYWPQVEHYEN